MGPKVFGELEHLGHLQLRGRVLVAALKHFLKVVEAKAHSLGDSLGGVAGEEDVPLGEQHEERDHVLCQVLHFVHHEKVHQLGRLQLVFLYLAQNVVDEVHEVVGALQVLPLFVLQEDVVDGETLTRLQKLPLRAVGSHIVPVVNATHFVLVRVVAPLNFAEDFGPHDQRREAAGLLRDLGPELIYECLVVHFEAQVPTLHRVAPKVGLLASLGVDERCEAGERFALVLLLASIVLVTCVGAFQVLNCAVAPLKGRFHVE